MKYFQEKNNKNWEWTAQSVDLNIIEKYFLARKEEDNSKESSGRKKNLKTILSWLQEMFGSCIFSFVLI